MARWKKSFVVTAMAAAACTVGGLLAAFVPIEADTVNAVDAVAAIQQVVPEAVAGSVGTTAGTDSETAAVIETQTGSVTVPTDAVDGIQLAGGDMAALTIGLPFAKKASDASESHVSGVVVYDNNNGSSTVPVIRDGGVQINTVIDNANAPKRYPYSIGLADGQKLQLNPDGSAGADSVYVGVPWAKDAKGNDVSTHYEVDGNTLTQVIDFTAETAFPVVADPTVLKTTYTYSRADVERMWNTIQFVGSVCSLIDLPYMASLLCPGGARLRDAVSSAHYQKKRIKATFNNCGFTYCNYYEYTVVS